MNLKNPSRREMFKVGLNGLAVVSLSGTLPAFMSKLAFADPAAPPTTMPSDNILVVVQLSGGNDGLNTVIPVHNDLYYKARPVIGIKSDQLLALDGQLALNPGMTGFKKLFDDGQLAIVNGCGYPQPNRSHFRSMEIWQTANPTKIEPCGWLGHYIDHCLRGTDNPVKAVNIGSQLPQALIAESAPVPSLESIYDFRVQTDRNSPYDAKMEEKIIRDMNAVRKDTPALEFLSRQATNAIVSTENIRKVASAYKPDADYPNRGLGAQLKTIAQIINGKFGTRLFYCQVGGFDTHANQPAGHQQLLHDVTESIAAFHKDMAAKGYNDKITLMCFSEFGRRVNQNSSNGTDHGAAGPMFVSGGKVKPGLYGQYPSLADLDDGDLKFTTDFRSVYATLLDKWLNADSAKVLNGAYESVAFL